MPCKPTAPSRTPLYQGAYVRIPGQLAGLHQSRGALGCGWGAPQPPFRPASRSPPDPPRSPTRNQVKASTVKQSEGQALHLIRNVRNIRTAAVSIRLGLLGLLSALAFFFNQLCKHKRDENSAWQHAFLTSLRVNHPSFVTLTKHLACTCCGAAMTERKLRITNTPSLVALLGPRVALLVDLGHSPRHRVSRLRRRGSNRIYYVDYFLTVGDGRHSGCAARDAGIF